MSNSISSNISTRPEYGRQIQGRRPPPPAPASRFQGAQVGAESGESASLQVKTADGDTVSISLASLSRLQAGVYSAQSGKEGVSAAAYSSESGVAVSVEVNGTLDDKEVAEISGLLRKLVGAARRGAQSPPASTDLKTGALKTLDSYQFAYQAYQRASAASLDTGAV